MITDRELLEGAAKAAGIKYDAPASVRKPEAKAWFGLWINGTSEYAQGHYWNPLTDDGDALRLAVKLNILTYQTGLDGAYASTPMNWSCVERDGTDQCAKTRRAIVRAAYEIGRAKP